MFQSVIPRFTHGSTRSLERQPFALGAQRKLEIPRTESPASGKVRGRGVHSPIQTPRTPSPVLQQPIPRKTLAPVSAASTEPKGVGIALASMDLSVRPQDDLYRFSLGSWLKGTEIPSDRSSWGSYAALRETTVDNLEAIMKELRASSPALGSEQRKLVDLYESYINLGTDTDQAMEKLHGFLSDMDTISTPRDIISRMAKLQRIGVGGIPVDLDIYQDKADPSRYMVYAAQCTLGLPDRDYYLKDDEKYVEIRAQYRSYITDLMNMTGVEVPEDAADRIIALETKLAHAQWTRAQSRDARATYNVYTLNEGEEVTPNVSWAQFFRQAGLGDAKDFVMEQPSFFVALNDLLETVPSEDWSLLFKFKLLDRYGKYISQEVNDRHFEFHSKHLQGVPEKPAARKQAMILAAGVLRDAMGKLYVARHFSPQTKKSIEDMVENVRAVFAEAIRNNHWMSEPTKAKALDKLGKFIVKIGHPEKWRDYSDLQIDPHDILGNMLRANKLSVQRQFGKIGSPVDREEWFMAAHTVNAYFNPPLNEIVFPAARAQPPFFDPTVDDAANYGAFATVVGHEFSHGFDDQGRKYAGDGSLTDWWTEEDARRYEARAHGLVDQFNSYRPLPDVPINGALTLGENIGDLAGVTMAYRAYKRSLGGKKSEVINGLTGEERFFVSYAQMRGAKIRDEALRAQLKSDPHSPGEYRVTGIVRNMSEFYETFGVTEGDDLYLSPENRVKIW